MKIEEGAKMLVTTANWFVGPDGNQYRAVHGTVRGIRSDSEALGIATNRHSTNWYLEIGCMIVAGCQIHYAVRTDHVNANAQIVEMVDGQPQEKENPIFHADG